MSQPRAIVGQHLLADLHLDDEALLTQSTPFGSWLRAALEAEQARILDYLEHTFPVTSGVTGLFLLAESHASFHTWPEHGLVCLDIFSCGTMDPDRVLQRLLIHCPPAALRQSTVVRGTPAENDSRFQVHK